MSRYGYPKEAVVFEVLDGAGYTSAGLMRGAHVEAVGYAVTGDHGRIYCCDAFPGDSGAFPDGSDRGWCMISRELKPLTPAARDFLAIVKAQGGE